MKVGFLHVGADIRLPEIMVCSAKGVMNCPVVQMTDDVTPRVPGVDEVIRSTWNKKELMLYRLQHLANLDGEFLILDTDIIVQRDIRKDIGKCDAMLTRRLGPIFDKDGIDVVKEMPYNCGVMFCRNRAFWKKCLDILDGLPQEKKEWYGDQIAIRDAAPFFNVQELPCDEYNYTPLHRAEDVSRKAIVHYKGIRKDWMLWPRSPIRTLQA